MSTPTSFETTHGTVVLVAPPDARAMEARVRAILAEQTPLFQGVRLTIETNPAGPFPTWEPRVMLFLVSDAAGDAAARALAEEAITARLPLVPVVENLGTYRFDRVDPSLRFVKDRNAVGLEPGSEERLRLAVAANLGVAAATSDQRVFISYGRADGSEVARAVDDHLRASRFQTFRDTEDVPAGGVVQEVVMKSLANMDFVLLIDTLAAARSAWVSAEVVEAFRKRIPVCVLTTPSSNSVLCTVAREAPRVAWEDSVAGRERVRLAVSRCIASRVSLDTRMERVLAQLARTHDVERKRLDARRERLRLGRRSVVVEHEDASANVERLHRLFQGLPGPPRSDAAVFVCGDMPPARITSEALRWACGKHPLAVVTLAELPGYVERVLGTGRRGGP